MATRSGDSSARRSRQAMSRRTAPSLWWSTWKPRKSEGGSGGRSRDATPSSPLPGPAPAAKTMDYGGAAKLVEAAEEREVRRYLMLSSIGADDPEGGVEAMRPYLRAKSRADERLKSSSLDYTIIRPGSLTEDKGTGAIE